MRTCVLLLLILSSCRTAPQPGCTKENLDAMVQRCRVEFLGPSPLCIVLYSRLPPQEERDAVLSEYAIKSCNAQAGNGSIAECVASRATTCDQGNTQRDEVARGCSSGDSRPGPESSCDTACREKQRTCDEACGAQRACDQCLRAGQTLANCPGCTPAASFAACMDCSMKCRYTYLDCSDACPRA